MAHRIFVQLATCERVYKALRAKGLPKARAASRKGGKESSRSRKSS
ncbi:MAG: hypothetical protein M3Y59_22690 [Myxococcota bacterium]|nr:hypothetical protein [Myxococcota bacterium]